MMARRGGIVFLAVLAWIAGLAPGASAGTDDVAPEQDDPPGCVTATSEDDDGCGARGRDHFGNAGHRPPIEACAGQRSDAGSLITRIVPTGPVRDDGSLAFRSGACVYLPPGYGSSGLRYSVLYLLHGGGGDQADWASFGSVQRILDDAYAADPDHALIVVMPDGRSGMWFDYLDGRFRNETYVLRHLIPAVDERFRTIADRAGRAIVGLSNGGYGAMHLAAKAPDLFIAAGSMSGNLGARALGELGPDGSAYQQGNVPYQLAENLDHLDLIIDWGATCTSDVLVDACATWAFEQLFRGDNMAFRDRLAAVGHPGTVDYREAEGSHAWRWWTKWLAERDLPFLYERLSPPIGGATPVSPLPATFRYRSIFPAFSVWGYDVEVDRDVTEFLDLTDVTVGGFTARGTGTAVVTTAPRYEPGQAYAVAGAGEHLLVAVADGDGRLVVPVDLGPSHTSDQGTPEATVAAATGDDGVTRTVIITETSGSGAAAMVDGGGPGGPAAATRVATAGGPAAGNGAAADVAGRTGPAASPSSGGRAGGVATVPVVPAGVFTDEPVSVPLTLAVLVAAVGTAFWWRRRAVARRAVAA